MNSDIIKERLEKHFENDKVEVFDTRGTGDHFSIIVISDQFLKFNMVQRHQIIYKIFKNEITKKFMLCRYKLLLKKSGRKKNISK